MVVIAHLYGTPGKMEELKRVCDAHGALIVEDAAESLGAKYKLGGSWVETGTLGDYNCISFNGNNVFKIEGDVSFCNKVLKTPPENLVISVYCTINSLSHQNMYKTYNPQGRMKLTYRRSILLQRNPSLTVLKRRSGLRIL